MATVEISAEVAAFEYLVEGLNPPLFKKTVPLSTAAWAWNTSGNPSLLKQLPPATADWAWNTISSSDLVRKELLPGTGVTVQVWDRDYAHEGTLEGLLAIVDYTSLRFELVHSGVGACKVTLGAQHLDSEWLKRDNVLKFYVEGVHRGSYYIEDVLEIPVSPSEKKSITIVGNDVGSSLDWGTIAPENFGLPGQKVQRFWTNQTRGYILNQLYDEIQSRGTLRHLKKDGWTGLFGSTGEVWSGSQDLEFAAGGSFLKLLEEWTEYGVEWLVTPNFYLQLAPYIGRDLSDTIVLFPLDTVVGQETTSTRRDLRTVIYAEDAGGGVIRTQDLDAIEEWDQREQYVVFKDAVGAGSASASSHALLNLVKDQVVERRLKIDPLVQGRRPFVDFDRGDTVSAAFGTERFGFRVLAIAIAVDENAKVTSEVTLDYILEAQRKRRQRLLNNSGGGGASTGQQTAYAETTGTVLVTENPVDICLININAFISTYGKVGWIANGVASTALTLRADLIYEGSILKTFYHQVPEPGVDTGEITWLWSSIPQGEGQLFLRLRTSTGAFTLPAAGDGQLWIEAKGISGSSFGSADIQVTDDAPGLTNFVGITDTLDISQESLDNPPFATETVNELPIGILDTVGPTGSGEIILGVEQIVATNPEDGTTSSSGSFANNTTTTTIGNELGVTHGTWWRFDLPTAVDLTGVTVVDAFVSLNAAANSVLPTRVKFTAADAANPGNVTDRADFLDRPRGAVEATWEITVSNGVRYRTPNMSEVIQELIDTHGDLESILIFAEDNSSVVNGYSTWRAKEHPANTPPMLTIQFLQA